MAVNGPGARLSTLHTFLIQYSDHYEVRAIVIPILQRKLRALEVEDSTAESRAWPFHQSYK